MGVFTLRPVASFLTMILLAGSMAGCLGESHDSGTSPDGSEAGTDPDAGYEDGSEVAASQEDSETDGEDSADDDETAEETPAGTEGGVPEERENSSSSDADPDATNESGEPESTDPSGPGASSGDGSAPPATSEGEGSAEGSNTTGTGSDGTPLSASLVVVSHRGLGFDQGGYQVMGLVRNDGPDPASGITVTVRFYDDAETLVETAAVPPALAHLSAGADAPFVLEIASEPGAIARYEVTLQGTPSEDEPSHALLAVEVASAGPTSSGLYRVQGEVTNTGASGASDVRVLVGLLGTDGRLIALAERTLSPSDLAPGASAGFDVTQSASGQTVDGHRVWAGAA